MNMKPLRILATALTVLAVSGCAFAPGQHLRRSDVTSQSSDDGRLEIVTITSKLIAQEHAARNEQTLPAELFDYQPSPYQVGIGDILYVTVWDHPELTVPAGSQQQGALAGRLVQSDGTLFYPYIGKVKAAGKTPSEIREEISRRLAQYVE